MTKDAAPLCPATLSSRNRGTTNRLLDASHSFRMTYGEAMDLSNRLKLLHFATLVASCNGQKSRTRRCRQKLTLRLPSRTFHIPEPSSTRFLKQRTITAG